MTIKRLRDLAFYHAEAAMNNATAANAMGPCTTAQEFREKADWHRTIAEELRTFADALCEAFPQLSGGDAK